MLPQFSELKSNPSKKPVSSRQHLQPEDGSNMFLQNISRFSRYYMALYHRKQDIL
jgi:hypothetical protein